MSPSSWIKTIFAAFIATALAACSSSGPTAEEYVAENSVPPVGSYPPASSSAPPPAQQTAIGLQQYLLGNGDRVRITVFGEPDLSGEFEVDGFGQVSVPLIGEVSAVNKTIRDLQRDLEARYRGGGYLLDPKISAEVVNYRPYYIMGEVNLPGEYPYISGLTVLNAVATAQGFTYRANKKVVFVRGANDTQEREVRLSSTLQVQPGDTVRIGERLF